MKKLFIFSAILLVVVLIFLGIYNFVFKSESAETKNSSQESSQNSKAPAEKNTTNSKISVISEQAIVGPFIDTARQKVVYYSAKEGTVWQSDFDGSKIGNIEATKVSGIKNISWAADGRRTLAKIETNGKTEYSTYDHLDNVGKKFKEGTDVVVWNNEGNGVIYKYFDSQTKKRSLNVAKPDGSEWKQIADIPYQKISIAPVPQTSLISFWELPSAGTQSALQIVGSLGGEVKTIFSGKYGADYAWAKDGKKAAVSFLTQSGKSNTNLGIVTLDGEYQDLGIPTLASKIAWTKDGKTIYYALPGNIPDGSVMPDDYDSKKFTSSDTFWKVDIETGKKERIVEAEDIKQDYDATQLLLTPNEDSLLFINRKDGKLYRLSL